MLDRKGLEADPADPKLASGLNRVAIGERKAVNQPPSLFRRIDRAGRAMGKTGGVIGMGMGDDDCGRIDPL